MRDPSGRLAAIKSAKKRCISMGVTRPWRSEFDEHPLAPAISNNCLTLIEQLKLNELRLDADYGECIGYIESMARAINRYCDTHKVKGDEAAEYWLAKFLDDCDSVCNWDYLSVDKE